MNTGRFAQEGDDLFDFAEGNDVAQLLLAGIEPHTFAAVLRDVRAKQFFRLESGGEKVHVVHERVGNVGVRKSSGKLRLPDALGKPRAGGTLSKMFFQVA